MAGIDRAGFDRTEIEAMVQRWLDANRAAEAAGDWKPMADLYTEDATYGWNYGADTDFMAVGREEIRELLTRYRDMGCRRVVALRGDLPSGMAAPGDFRYANELVSFIRSEFGDSFHIEVACYPESHPQARDAQTDLANFKRKVEAGANGAITQYFFNADAYFRFRDDVAAAGIDIPLTAGVMPISNFAQLRRFSQMCGAEIPRWIDTHMTGFGDDTTAIRQFGADVVASMCRRLIEGGVQGLHLYTLNRAQATLAVLDRL